MDYEGWEKEIEPFEWSENDNNACVYLDVRGYLQDVFDSRSAEGFEGNGYDWESLAKVFIQERCPEALGQLIFDSEAGLFCVYSKQKEMLRKFICLFKNACERKGVILDLFTRAKLD